MYCASLPSEHTFSQALLCFSHSGLQCFGCAKCFIFFLAFAIPFLQPPILFHAISALVSSPHCLANFSYTSKAFFYTNCTLYILSCTSCYLVLFTIAEGLRWKGPCLSYSLLFPFCSILVVLKVLSSTSSISIIWEPVREASSQAPHQIY